MENFTSKIKSILKNLNENSQLSKDALIMLNSIMNKFILHFDDINYVSNTEIKYYINMQGAEQVKKCVLNSFTTKIKNLLMIDNLEEACYIAGGCEYFISEILDPICKSSNITADIILNAIFEDSELLEIIQIICGIF